MVWGGRRDRFVKEKGSHLAGLSKLGRTGIWGTGVGVMMGWEDPLEKGKATHSSILASRIPWIV